MRNPPAPPSLFQILRTVNVESRDDGQAFTVTERLEAIERLLRSENAHYAPVVKAPLVHLYAPCDLSLLGEDLVLVSTHADTVPAMTRYFTRRTLTGGLRGTFDNSLTNALAVSLMLDGGLRDNVVFAFTGDEERFGQGAVQAAELLRAAGKRFRAVSLDVTPMGYREKFAFTVENDYLLTGDAAEAVVRAAERTKLPWGITVVDPERYDPAFPVGRIFRDRNGEIIPALPDEARTYGRRAEACRTSFSLCIPTAGEMHGNRGILVRRGVPEGYKTALRAVVNALVQVDTF